jgi:hypothetical protein
MPESKNETLEEQDGFPVRRDVRRAVLQGRRHARRTRRADRTSAWFHSWRAGTRRSRRQAMQRAQPERRRVQDREHNSHCARGRSRRGRPFEHGHRQRGAMNPRTLVYVAGPFSGKGATREEQRADTELKIKRAEALGLKVARLGAYPVIPHCNTSHPEFEDVQPYQFWIDGHGRATTTTLRCCPVHGRLADVERARAGGKARGRAWHPSLLCSV